MSKREDKTEEYEEESEDYEPTGTFIELGDTGEKEFEDSEESNLDGVFLGIGEAETAKFEESEESKVEGTYLAVGEDYSGYIYEEEEREEPGLFITTGEVKTAKEDLLVDGEQEIETVKREEKEEDEDGGGEDPMENEKGIVEESKGSKIPGYDFRKVYLYGLILVGLTGGIAMALGFRDIFMVATTGLVIIGAFLVRRRIKKKPYKKELSGVKKVLYGLMVVLISLLMLLIVTDNVKNGVIVGIVMKEEGKYTTIQRCVTEDYGVRSCIHDGEDSVVIYQLEGAKVTGVNDITETVNKYRE